MLEEKVSEERDPDLNEEEDIIMEDRREEHWRDVAEYGDNKFYIHALWDVYTREEGGIRMDEIRYEYSMDVAEDGDNKKKIHVLILEVQVK